MIRDYWVYQQRDTDKPWALYVVKEFEKGNILISDITFDVTLYQDDIPNATQSHSVVGITGSNVDDVVSQIGSVILEHTEFTDYDRAQVKNAIIDIACDTSSRRRSSRR